MWDGTIRGRRRGDSLHLRVDEIGDLTARFGRLWAHERLEVLQKIARDMAIALELIDESFTGRVLISQPTHRPPEPMDPAAAAEPDGSEGA